MRRAYRGRSDAMVRSAEGEQGFWPSYADMMSAVALILFFLMLLSYISNMITGNSLKTTQNELELTQQDLSDKEKDLNDLQRALSVIIKEVEDAQAELDTRNQELEQANQSLEQTRQNLSQVQTDLEAKERDLKQKEEDLASQDALLLEQAALIREQEEYMQSASRELLEMRGQMQTIAVLRLSILQQIRDSVAGVMGDATKVSISDNGNIVLNEGVFFDVGSSAIKAEGLPTLNQLIVVFAEFLSDPQNTKYVDSIVISGHTDSTGPEDNNRILSTSRANAVLNYLLANDGGILNPYASYFCAAGYGETRPVASNDTEEGRAQNRRIEISIILRDDSVLDIVNDYLAIEVPESVERNGGAGE